jgi:hypothetical protein
MAPVASFSDGAEFLRSPLIEVTHQPLQILGGGREVELLCHVPQSSQSHSAKFYLLFELGEQSLSREGSAMCHRETEGLTQVPPNRRRMAG